MNRYAIGDIHGGYFTFHALINQICPKHDDRIYLLGDYVDRGADSCGVLELIIRMQETGCDIRPLRGNHDDMLLRNITGQHDDYSWYWMKGWGYETLKSFSISTVEEMPERYLNFLQSLPYSYHDGDFCLVHAGLDLTVDEPLSQSSPLAMMWGDCGPFRKGRLQGKTLVTGHNIRPLPLIETSLLSNHFQLDNGAFSNMLPDMGNLVALNLDTLQLTLQPWLDDEALP